MRDTGVMATSCDECGAVPCDDEQFHEAYASFRSRKVFYCPDCWPRHACRKTAFLLIGWIGGIGLPIIVLALFMADQSSRSSLLSVPLIAFFWILLTVPHELAHALIARLVGWRVFSITLGTGRIVGVFRIAGFRFNVKAWPAGGVVHFAPYSRAHCRLKHFLAVLAGPSVHIVLLSLLFYWYSPYDMLMSWYGGWPWLACLALANFGWLIGTLLPHMSTVAIEDQRTRVPSDGLALLTIPFQSEAAIDGLHASYFFWESMACYRQGTFESAKLWLLKGLEHYPDDVATRINLGSVLLFLKDFHGARDQWLLVLDRQDQPQLIRATMLNNIAWANLMIGGSELLEEADRFSEEALRESMRPPAFQNTRGSVLIEKRDATQGLPLVRNAFKSTDDPRLKALSACYIAIGECMCGNTTEASKMRELAQRLDSTCVLLAKVERQLAQGPEEKNGKTNEEGSAV